MRIVRLVRRRLWDFAVPVAGVLLVALGLLAAVLGYVFIYPIPPDPVRMVTDFYANLGTELFSIGITVLVIDYLYQRRSKQQQRAELIQQMASPDNGFAIEAVRRLRLDGWLTDGSLQGAVLERANLKYADLRRANLTDTNLWHAILVGANLIGANLEGARLFEANLEGAHLFGANLSGASLTAAYLENVKYDDTTTWPAGFTPPPNVSDAPQ